MVNRHPWLQYPLLTIGKYLVPGGVDQLAWHEETRGVKVGLPLGPFLCLTRAADDTWFRISREQYALIANGLDETAMQSPVPTAFVHEGKTVTPFDRRVLLGVQAFVDDDSARVKPDCPEDVRLQIEPAARHIEESVQVVELDAKLEIFLNDILDRDRRTQLDGSRLSELAEQDLRVTLDSVVGHIGNSKRHSGSSSSASSSAANGAYFSFALCACRARRAMSSAVSPLAARRKSAISRGRSRIISVRSEATRPALANSSSASCPRMPAIFRTLSSAGGGNSSRSTFDRYV